MGRVWLASELGAEHYVALKTSIIGGDDFRAALLDEARIASRIHHPNVCAVHAADQQSDLLYLVMDWSDGGSLRELLDTLPEGRLAPRLAARIASRVASGLEAVHQLRDDDGELMGVIHRDVSPQNVLISKCGQVRLTDFGIAKARNRLREPTRTGQIKGKVSYMSPEQAKGLPLDRRADVFALGCVLYEMTTGTAPFRGDDAVSTMYQLLEQPLRLPSDLVDSYPLGLQTVVVKALAKRPEERFESAEKLARSLERFLAAESHLVLDEELGELIAVTFEQQIAERQRGINEARAGIDRYVLTAESRFTSGDSVTPTSTPTVLQSGTPAQVTSAAPDSSKPRRDGDRAQDQEVATPHIRSWLLGGSFLLATAALFVAVLNSRVALVQGTTSLPPSAVHRDSKRLPLPESKAGKLITLTLTAEPANATWHVDDGPALANPVDLKLPQDARTHVVRAQAAGYDHVEQGLQFDEDQRITVTLRPADADPSPHTEASARIPRSHVHGIRRTVHGVQASEISPSAGGGAAPLSSGSVLRTLPTARPIRELDPENPFR